jgi:uncharacterized membrane protein YraQ (UPF0718 family)
MAEKPSKSGKGGWLFLLSVLVVYAAVWVIDRGQMTQALDLFGQVMGKVLPILALVFVLLLAADLFLSPKWIKRNLGRESGLKGWFMAAFGGVLATGPIYPWYALLQELRGKGMRASLVAVFLYSRAIKLPLLPLMVHYFGVTFTLVLCLYLLAFSIVNGILVGLLQRTRPT